MKEEYVTYSDIYPPYSGRTHAPHMSDWQTRIDMDKLRKDRHAKLLNEMREEGVSVMFLLQPWNIRVATGYHGLTYTSGLSYAICPVEGEPILYGHGTPAIQDRRQMKWLKPENIRYAIPTAVGMMSSGLWTHPEALKYQVDKVVQQLKKALDERKLTKEVLTLDTSDPGLQAALEKAGIKTEVKAALPIKAQEIKTPEEIDCFRIVSGITDLVHYEMAKYAEPGMTEYEIAGYMDYIGMKYGGEPTPGSWCGSGPHTWPNFRNSTDRVIRPGDIFYADAIQVSWNGYKSCHYRTYSAGWKPTQKAEDCYKRINEWLYSALSDCKPGNTTWDMLKHWPAEETWQGLPADYCWGDNVMHGIGLVNYGPPQGCRAWSEKYPYELKEGHVFAIECQDSIGDGQGCRVEDHVVITKDGCEVLTRFPSDHITVVPMKTGQWDVEFEPPEERLKRFAGKYPPEGYRATVDADRYREMQKEQAKKRR